jgi:hypothetical protein
MSILAQQPLRKPAQDSHESKKSQDPKVPKEEFKELLKVQPATENSREKDFFALVAKEEEDKRDPKEGPCYEMRSATSLSSPEMEAINNSVSRLANLSPAIEAAFERMASCMIMMTSSQETETILFLDNPHFASSPLFGSKITLREFSTAPKAFNIEIASNPQGTALINTSKTDLLAAFQRGDFNFSVHRLETYLHERADRPVLHRQETKDKNGDKQGGRAHE